MNGAETMMTVFMKARRGAPARGRRGGRDGGVRLDGPGGRAERKRPAVGVSAQATGKTAAVLIEATEPVAYAVSRPDPLTVLVDLRDVTRRRRGERGGDGRDRSPASRSSRPPASTART